MATIRGNQILTGTWGELWIDNELIAEMSKVNAKVSANREDVQFGVDVDSKVTGLKGEITITVKRLTSRFSEYLESWQKGEDLRCQVITKLQDPNAKDKGIERYSIDNVWFNDLDLVNYERGAIIEQEISGGFTPSDMKPLDKIAK